MYLVLRLLTLNTKKIVDEYHAVLSGFYTLIMDKIENKNQSFDRLIRFSTKFSLKHSQILFFA